MNLWCIIKRVVYKNRNIIAYKTILASNMNCSSNVEFIRVKTLTRNIDEGYQT